MSPTVRVHLYWEEERQKAKSKDTIPSILVQEIRHPEYMRDEQAILNYHFCEIHHVKDIWIEYISLCLGLVIYLVPLALNFPWPPFPSQYLSKAQNPKHKTRKVFIQIGSGCRNPLICFHISNGWKMVPGCDKPIIF